MEKKEKACHAHVHRKINSSFIYGISFLHFIEVQLIYNVVLLSAVLQSDSGIYMYIYIHIYMYMVVVI